MNNLATLQTFGQENLTALKNLSKEPRFLQTVGLVALAAATGGVAGLLVAKGLVAAKGAVAAKTVVAAKGGAAAVAPHITQSGATLLQQAAANSATALQNANNLLTSVTTNGTAALNNATGLINNVTTSGAALSHQLTTLFNTLSNNALPLTAGAVGGGAVGVGVTQRKVNEVQTQLDEKTVQAEVYQTEATRLQEALKVTEAKLNEAQTTIAVTPVVPAPAPAPSPAAKPVQDQLEEIRGIGPVFARHLNASGIFTFAELAAQTPEQLQKIMAGVRANRMFNPETWIAEARQRVAGIQEKPTEPVTSVASSADAPTVPLVLERLETLPGVTPLYASRLNAAGILTYADVAAQTPARLQEITGATEDTATFQQWIAVAQRLQV